MLKLNSVVDVKEYLCDIDEYIPFSINFVLNSDETICFRFGNGNTSLLEISIDKNTFEISNITLVTIDAKKIFLCNKERIEDGKILITGFPIFKHKEILKNNELFHIDNFEKDIKMFIGDQYVYLTINEYDTFTYVKNNNIFFGFDIFENLNSIFVTNISINDIEILKNSYKY